MRFLPPALVVALVLAAVPQPVQAEKPTIKIAVPGMRHSGVEANLGPTLTEIITVETSEIPGVSVVASSDIAAMLGFEKQKDLVGCSDDLSCIAEIGGALGVDLLLVSDLGLVGKSYVLNLKLVDTKKAAVLKRVYKVVTGEADALIETVRTSLPVLLAVVTGETPPPAAAAEPNEAPTPASAPVVVAEAGPSRWPQWALIGGGGAMVVVATGLGIFAAQEASLADEQVSVSGVSIHSSDANDRLSSAAWKSYTGLAVGLAGGAMVVGGALWLMLGSDTTDSVAVAPAVDSHGAGLVVGGSF